MDELKRQASRKCGLSEELADLAIGGYLSVLKHSEKLDAGVVDKILDRLGKEAAINMKQYEKIRAQNSGVIEKIPVLGAIFKGKGPIQAKVEERKDPDAAHTKDMVDLLINAFEGFDEKKLVEFMKVFTEVVQDEVTEAVDIDEVLRMPE